MTVFRTGVRAGYEFRHQINRSGATERQNPEAGSRPLPRFGLIWAFCEVPSKKIEGYRWQSFTPPAAGKPRRFRGLICHRRSHATKATAFRPGDHCNFLGVTAGGCAAAGLTRHAHSTFDMLSTCEAVPSTANRRGPSKQTAKLRSRSEGRCDDPTRTVTGTPSREPRRPCWTAGGWRRPRSWSMSGKGPTGSW